MSSRAHDSRKSRKRLASLASLASNASLASPASLASLASLDVISKSPVGDISVVYAHKRSRRLSLTKTFRISHRHIASTYLSRTHVASLADTHYISFRNKCVYRREVLQCFHIPEAISWVALSVAIQASSGWSNRSWWSMSHCKPAIV